MTAAAATILSLILGISFIGFVLLGFPSLLYMLYLWFRLERELVERRPFSFADANLIWNPPPERYSLKGREVVPLFLKWQRVGFGCLLGAAIAGPTALWIGQVGA